MPRQRKSFKFKSVLSAYKTTFMSKVIFLPSEIVKELPEERVRAKGTINAVPFDLAPQYLKDGRRYFAVNAKLQRDAKVQVNDPVTVEFKLTDYTKLEIPEELAALLEQDEKANEVWQTFKVGLQRSLIHYITSVRNVDSRIKRSIELMERAKAGTLLSQKPASNKTKKSRPNEADR